MGTPGVIGSKAHQRLNRCLGVLNDILDGFDNQAAMNTTLKEVIENLQEPQLPYSEINAILSSLSGRIPSKLEDNIRTAIDAARSKGERTEFPALRIKKLINHYVQDSILSQDRAMFRTKIAGLYEVLERYQGGLKGHGTETIAKLLERYEATEKLFGGSIEARVLALREQYKDDLDTAIGFVLSHIKVQSKVKLVLAILNYVKDSGINVSNPESRLFKVLQGLASLEAKYVVMLSIEPVLGLTLLRSSTSVSLKAREVLILGQMPSYEERLIQMEAILKNSVTNNYYGESGQAPRCDIF